MKTLLAILLLLTAGCVKVVRVTRSTPSFPETHRTDCQSIRFHGCWITVVTRDENNESREVWKLKED